METKKAKIFITEIEDADYNGINFWKIKGTEVELDMPFNASLWKANLRDKLNTNAEIWIQYEEKVQGQYTNRKILNVGDVDGNFIERQPSKGFVGGGKADPAKLDSIERQSASKQTLEYMGQMGIGFEQFDSMAHEVLKFITGGKK